MSPHHPKCDFTHRLIAWQKTHGRHTLPWQGSEDPYRIWLSEIMLQQTQVETVLPYYVRFLSRFPDIEALAGATEEEVMAHWAGLGYYSRARNLHKAARRVVSEHDARFPEQFDAILALPGIGRSTAAAIAVFAFGHRRAILDGNVKRVLARVYGIAGWPGNKQVENQLWQLAESLLPAEDIQAYTQGLMDLGATRCTRNKPGCADCPFSDDCLANLQGRQKDLPGARPKKSLPEKSTAMLILKQGDAVLLEKRPAPGIWGGLWSLPEYPLEIDPARTVAGMGYGVGVVEKRAPSRHAFTHFRLNIQPWLVNVDRPTFAAEPGCIWLPLDDIDSAALPTPVRRILSSLRVT